MVLKLSVTPRGIQRKKKTAGHSQANKSNLLSALNVREGHRGEGSDGGRECSGSCGGWEGGRGGVERGSGRRAG